MKRMVLILALLAVALAPSASRAEATHSDGTGSYSGTILNDSGLAYSKTAQIDTNDAQVSRLSAQAVYSSANISGVSFTDGRRSTQTISIATNTFTFLSSAAAVDTIKIASNTVLPGTTAYNTISIASNGFCVVSTNPVFITLKGTTLTANMDWTVTPFATMTAINLAAAINRAGIYGIGASTGGTFGQTGSTVTIISSVPGTSFNAYTLSASSPAALVVASATFINGKDPVSFTLNGIKFTANRQFIVNTQFSSATAFNIASLLNFSSYSITAVTSSINGLNSVTLSVRQFGTYGNTFTLTSSSVALQVDTNTFTGGREAAVLQANGFLFQNGLDWTTGASASATAKSLSDAMMANPGLYNQLRTTWTTLQTSSVAVIYATSVFINHNDYTLTTSSQAWLSISTIAGRISLDGSATGYFVNGASSPVVLVNSYFVLVNTFTAALPVIFSSATGTTPAPLVSQVTYYITNASRTQFQLAYTATGALAGLGLTITTQTQSGNGSFSITPAAFAGVFSFKWQYSNDGATWFDANVASVTITPVLPSSSTAWDFGNSNYRYYRVNAGTATATTTGAVNLKVDVNGKK